MAQHQDDCEICRRIAECRAGTHPGFVAETETGFAVMGDSQYFRGYCLLLCKSPATELDELSPAIRAIYLEEMALLAQAVREVVRPHKLNYECLGNMVPHLHWHIFPRQLSEAEPLKPVWTCMPQGDTAERYEFDAARDSELKAEIRAAFLRLLPNPKR